MTPKTARTIATTASFVFIASAVWHFLALGTPQSRYIGRATFCLWAAAIIAMLVVHSKSGNLLADAFLRVAVKRTAWTILILFLSMTCIHLATAPWMARGWFKISGWSALSAVIVLFVFQQILLYWFILPQLEKIRAAT